MMSTEAVCMAGSPGAMGCPQRAQASRVMVVCIFCLSFLSRGVVFRPNEARPRRFPVEGWRGLVARLVGVSRLCGDVGDLAVVQVQGDDMKGTLRQWSGWCMRNDWVNRAAEHDSDLASRRRERMAKALDREKDYAVTLVGLTLKKVEERIEGMDFKGLEARQVPVALKRLFELEFMALGMEDKVALSFEGKVEVEAAADTAWLMDYLRQLREGSGDEGQPEG